MGVRLRKFSDIRLIGARRILRRQQRRARAASGRRHRRHRPDPAVPGAASRRAAQHADASSTRRSTSTISGTGAAGTTSTAAACSVHRIRRATSCVETASGMVKTRQIIRFASVASQMTGPAVSDFEMSFSGRSWPKIGKKLLQGNRHQRATRTSRRWPGNWFPPATASSAPSPTRAVRGASRTAGPRPADGPGCA